MRMQSVGKCSGSVVAGALLVFSLILLYNYWDVSTANRDLLLKLHTAEHQILTLAKANEALDSSVEKGRAEKSRLDGSLKSQVQSRQRAEEELQQKEEAISRLQKLLATEKDEAKMVKEQLAEVRKTVEEKDAELVTTKEKVLSLEAQLAEKETERERLEKALKAAEDRPSPKPSVPAPATKLDDTLAQPVLINDPAVPYPAGWMKAGQRERPVIRISQPANKGIQSRRGPVIILDPPNSPRVQARFSVLDPPKPQSHFYRPIRPHAREQQMNPELSPPAGAHAPAVSNKEKELENGGGGGEVNNEGIGVLPVPGANLDAAEEDGEQGVKEEGAGPQDDQSPDGALSPKEIKDSGNNKPAPGVLPPPPAQLLPNEPNNNPGQSGQDNREAAHLNHLNSI